MARCRFGNLAAFQWEWAAAPARRQFGIRDVLLADMPFSMHKPRASKRKIKSAEALPKIFTQIPSFWSARIGVCLVYWPVDPGILKERWDIMGSFMLAVALVVALTEAAPIGNHMESREIAEVGVSS